MENKEQLNQEKNIEKADQELDCSIDEKKATSESSSMSEDVKSEIIMEEKEKTLVPEQEQIQEPVEETKSDEQIDAVETESPKDEETESSKDEETESEDTHEDIDEGEFEKLSREELIKLLEEAVNSEDVVSVKQKVIACKSAFINLMKESEQEQLNKFLEEGGEKIDFRPVEDPLKKKFSQLSNLYREKKKQYAETQEKIKTDNFAKKNQILESIRELLVSEETLKETYDKFRELQDQWKEIGAVPSSEVKNLWENYHFLVEKFFEKVKLNRELRDLGLKRNLEKKIEICEKAEELLLDSSVNNAFSALQTLHQDWKEIGPVAVDKSDEIWDRFKSASDKINARRRELREERMKQQMEAYEAKQALCEKAEEIIAKERKNPKDWQADSDALLELMKNWKETGFAPKKFNDAIWDRFRGSFNALFSAKKDYFQKLKDEQNENYQRKIELCIQAEGIKDSNDWGVTTKELIRLQAEWKKIGMIPRKHRDKIWQRFRAACDEFFNRKSEHFSDARASEDANLKLKEELIARVKGFEPKDSKDENIAALKELQREWMNIGHVPFKLKDKIYSDFRGAMDSLVEKMQVSEFEVTRGQFAEHIQSMKQGDSGERQLDREKYNLKRKIDRIKEDIQLWENNILFFADSKQANVLKNEVQKKINRAKGEIKLLQAKIDLIKEQA